MKHKLQLSKSMKQESLDPKESTSIDVVVICKWCNSSVISKRTNLKTGVSRKQSTPNFPKNKHFLPTYTHTYVCVSGGKKCSGSFSENLGCFVFLNTRFEVRPISLLPTNLKTKKRLIFYFQFTTYQLIDPTKGQEMMHQSSNKMWYYNTMKMWIVLTAVII